MFFLFSWIDWILSLFNFFLKLEFPINFSLLDVSTCQKNWVSCVETPFYLCVFLVFCGPQGRSMNIADSPQTLCPWRIFSGVLVGFPDLSYGFIWQNPFFSSKLHTFCVFSLRLNVESVEYGVPSDLCQDKIHELDVERTAWTLVKIWVTWWCARANTTI